MRLGARGDLTGLGSATGGRSGGRSAGHRARQIDGDRDRDGDGDGDSLSGVVVVGHRAVDEWMVTGRSLHNDM